MEEVGKRIVPSGKLVLAGCNNGRESMEEHSDPFSLTTSDHPSSSVSDMNIAESFSNNAPTLIVYASPDLIYNMTPSVFHLPSSSFPEFLPYFKVGPIDSSRYFKGPIGSSRKVRAYMKGRKVAEGGPSDGVADKLRLLLLDQINLDIKKPRDLSITG
jgi:hypothetical protein